MSTILAEPEVSPDEQYLVLPGVSWDQYVAINDAFLERRGLRVVYIDERLTLLTLSRRHDWTAEYLDKILMAIALGCEIHFDVAGSATFRLKDKSAALDGDKTYCFGAKALIMGDPIDIDFTTQPPPDLAIEVEVSHSANDAIAAYARIGVPEVWRYHARRRTLAFLVLQVDGSYQAVTQSRNLPLLKPDDVLVQLKIAEELNSFSRWYAQLTEWVRISLLPRAQG